MTTTDTQLLIEAYHALEAVQLHTGNTLLELLEEPDTLGDLLNRLQVRVMDEINECPGCYRTIAICNANPCEKRQGELDEDTAAEVKADPWVEDTPCVSCGAPVGMVAWTPTGGDPHCEGCAGAAHGLSVALERIRDQEEPQHPTGTWARDVAREALAALPVAPTGSGRTPLHDAIERPDPEAP